MNVLSLFDGMSCGQLALQKAGIKYENYFASEIDRFAIKVTQKNFPKTIQLGDVTKIKSSDLPNIDLLIGGSPCQGFSFAGKQLNFNDPRSRLFFEYVRLLKELKPKNFLLENVKMKKESADIISREVSRQPVVINSAKFTAQHRIRLYWTDIPFEKDFGDKGFTWRDVHIKNAEKVYYVTEKMFKWIHKDPKRSEKFKLYDQFYAGKMQMLEASHHKGISNQRCFAIVDEKGLRYIHPVECERLQGVPDGYTDCVSNSQRYKMLGNGWTIDVVAHIFKGLKQ